MTHRYTKTDGLIGFTVRINTRTGGSIAHPHEIDVDLVDIYEHVTPEELERFENHDWELEDARERQKPKLGRPRKYISTLDLGGLTSRTVPLKRRGRPRKGPPKSLENQRTPVSGPRESSVQHSPTFVGVHIPSPHNQRASLPVAMSPIRSGLMSLGSVPTRDHERTSSSAEDFEILDTQCNGTQVDQLNASNANRVVGVKLPSASPSIRRHRPSYAMVQAALGDSESSDAAPMVPDSQSEDELSLLLTTQPKHPAVPRKVSLPDDQQESLFLTPMGSVDGGLADNHGSRFGRRDSPDSNDPSNLLEKFGASNARRIPPKRPSSVSTDTKPPNTIHNHFRPKHVSPIVTNERSQQQSLPSPVVKSYDSIKSTPKSIRYIRKSMTPHFPSPKRARAKLLSPRLRGGRRDQSTNQRSPIKVEYRPQSILLPNGAATSYDRTGAKSLLDSRTKALATDGEIFLGDPFLSSDEINPTSADHHPSTGRGQYRFSYDKEIVLGSPVTSSSSEAGAAQSSKHRRTSSAHGPRKRKRSANESNEGGGTWFRMPWR
ncbi:MAG: hypothetical protein Q9170_003083 [Blastenia crenularia]